MADIREISEESVRRRRRMDKRDWLYLAEYLCEEYDSRKAKRKHQERIWAEVDRQLAMIPDTRHKLDQHGRPDPRKQWMAEVELPMQAQTLEVLTADARRMLFPDSGLWFAAHAVTTDEYLARVDMQSFIAGDENDVPSIITQDNADKLVAGAVMFWQRQYDFYGNVDLINAEAFKYGTGVGRVRLITKDTITAKGARVSRQRIKYPALVPRSVKQVYLDDSCQALMNEGYAVEPLTLTCKKMRIEDLRMAALKGSTDPEAEDGGWMPEALKGLAGDKTHHIELIEAEGDLLIPRKTTDSLFLPGVLVDVVRGSQESGGGAAIRVVRFRVRPDTESSFIQFPYHRESPLSAYATSPLIKGWPIQAAASDALGRLMECAALQVQPPVAWDANDMKLSANGGPAIYPGALWDTLGDIMVHKVGDASVMLQVYAGLLMQYADVTGVNAPRLGAQTLSHTTAYAKEAELSRGTVRTVDYVRQTLGHPLLRFLSLAYLIGRRHLKRTIFYADGYQGHVEASGEDLPPHVLFEAFGAGGPAEEQAKAARKLQALQLALQMDNIAKSQGMQTDLSIPRMIDHVLREGGWTDVDALKGGAGTPGAAAGGSEMAGAAPQAPINPAAALQALAFSGQ